MYRMIPHPHPLPACSNGHVPQHVHDNRPTRSSLTGQRLGGHLVECGCSRTDKHDKFDDALAQWRRMHGSHVVSVATSFGQVRFLQGGAS